MKTILTTERVVPWFADLRDDIKTALALARELLEKTMALKLRKWDTAEYLKTEEDMALYLEACLAETGDDAAFTLRRWAILPVPKA